MGIPLLATASAANLASSVEDVRTAGTIPTSRILAQISSFCMDAPPIGSPRKYSKGSEEGVLFKSGIIRHVPWNKFTEIQFRGRFCAAVWECYASARDSETARVVREKRLPVFELYG